MELLGPSKGVSDDDEICSATIQYSYIYIYSTRQHCTRPALYIYTLYIYTLPLVSHAPPRPLAAMSTLLLSKHLPSLILNTKHLSTHLNKLAFSTSGLQNRGLQNQLCISTIYYSTKLLVTDHTRLVSLTSKGGKVL